MKKTLTKKVMLNENAERLLKYIRGRIHEGPLNLLDISASIGISPLACKFAYSKLIDAGLIDMPQGARRPRMREILREGKVRREMTPDGRHTSGFHRKQRELYNEK